MIRRPFESLHVHFLHLSFILSPSKYIPMFGLHHEPTKHIRPCQKLVILMTFLPWLTGNVWIFQLHVVKMVLFWSLTYFLFSMCFFPCGFGCIMWTRNVLYALKSHIIRFYSHLVGGNCPQKDLKRKVSVMQDLLFVSHTTRRGKLSKPLKECQNWCHLYMSVVMQP